VSLKGNVVRACSEYNIVAICKQLLTTASQIKEISGERNTWKFTALATRKWVISELYLSPLQNLLFIKKDITSSMEMSPSWQAASCASTQRFSSILWNPKVHYHVHKSSPLFPILRQINPVYTTPSYLWSILVLSTHLHLGLPTCLFPPAFPTNILYTILFSPFVLHPLSISTSLTLSF
jgi:hypothetical protein